MTSPSPPKAAQDEARRKRTVAWVVGLATLGLIFDGYDLVVYGTVVSTFLRHPDEIGAVTPAAAGALGSYALVGVLVGALLAGALGDIVGRRKVMLAGYAWFAVFMIFTALATTPRSSGSAGSSRASGSVRWSARPAPSSPSSRPRGRRTSATPSPTPVSRSAACSPRCSASCCRNRSAGAGCSGSARFLW